jgi:hypothetical protein
MNQRARAIAVRSYYGVYTVSVSKSTTPYGFLTGYIMLLITAYNVTYNMGHQELTFT